jgi:hypothetical protein
MLARVVLCPLGTCRAGLPSLWIPLATLRLSAPAAADSSGPFEIHPIDAQQFSESARRLVLAR